MRNDVQRYVEREQSRDFERRQPGKFMYPGRRWPLQSNQCWADSDMMKLLTLYSYPNIREKMPFILRHMCKTLSNMYCNRKWDEGNKFTRHYYMLKKTKTLSTGFLLWCPTFVS